MAAEDTFESQYNTSRKTITLYGCVGIDTARRVKTAKPFPKHHPHKPMLERESFLVQTDKGKDDFFKHTKSIILAPPFCQLYLFTAIMIKIQPNPNTTNYIQKQK